jgi:hypothetical protein
MVLRYLEEGSWVTSSGKTDTYDHMVVTATRKLIDCEKKEMILRVSIPKGFASPISVKSSWATFYVLECPVCRNVFCQYEPELWTRTGAYSNYCSTSCKSKAQGKNKYGGVCRILEKFRWPPERAAACMSCEFWAVDGNEDLWGSCERFQRILMIETAPESEIRKIRTFREFRCPLFRKGRKHNPLHKWGIMIDPNSIRFKDLRNDENQETMLRKLQDSKAREERRLENKELGDLQGQ